MGRIRLPDPMKYCQSCGHLLARKRFPSGLEDITGFRARLYCGQRCMARAYMGKIKVPSDEASRRQSSRMVKQHCEKCGTLTKLNVHHLDENPQNNDPSNLMTLCASCHHRWHWEVGKMSLRRSGPCKVCATLSRKLGYCQKHYQRFRKYGDPLLTKRGNGLGIYFVREGPDGRLSKC